MRSSGRKEAEMEKRFGLTALILTALAAGGAMLAVCLSIWYLFMVDTDPQPAPLVANALAATPTAPPSSKPSPTPAPTVSPGVSPPPPPPAHVTGPRPVPTPSPSITAQQLYFDATNGLIKEGEYRHVFGEIVKIEFDAAWLGQDIVYLGVDRGYGVDKSDHSGISFTWFGLSHDAKDLSVGDEVSELLCMVDIPEPPLVQTRCFKEWTFGLADPYDVPLPPPAPEVELPPRKSVSEVFLDPHFGKRVRVYGKVISVAKRYVGLELDREIELSMGLEVNDWDSAEYAEMKADYEAGRDSHTQPTETFDCWVAFFREGNMVLSDCILIRESE